GCGASARRAVRGVTAAERAHQVDAESEAARAQLRAQPLRLDHLILAREHAQVVVEAGAIALAREIVGALRGLERNLLLGGLALERPPVRDHVGDLAHRIEQRLVVLADRLVELRLLRAQRSARSEEHTSELQSLAYLVCRLLLEKKNHI